VKEKASASSRFGDPDDIAYADMEFWGEAVWGEALLAPYKLQGETPDRKNVRIYVDSNVLLRVASRSRPPFNAEYLLYVFLRREERDVVIGDLVEGYRLVLQRFNKRRADIWFYKQVLGSLWPLLRRAVLKIGALIWLGRLL
jgi:hypothetical protein